MEPASPTSSRRTRSTCAISATNDARVVRRPDGIQLLVPLDFFPDRDKLLVRFSRNQVPLELACWICARTSSVRFTMRRLPGRASAPTAHRSHLTTEAFS